MQRKYTQKKYYCGDYLEVVVYPKYTKAKGGRSGASQPLKFSNGSISGTQRVSCAVCGISISK